MQHVQKTKTYRELFSLRWEATRKFVATIFFLMHSRLVSLKLVNVVYFRIENL